MKSVQFFRVPPNTQYFFHEKNSKDNEIFHGREPFLQDDPLSSANSLEVTAALLRKRLNIEAEELKACFYVGSVLLVLTNAL